MAIKRVFVVLLATVSLASAVPADAQSERGNITGVVADPSRAGIPGVSVKVINTGTNATTQVVTGEAGTYTALNLPPGTYRIEAALQGFQTANVEGITLVAGATARVDVFLTLGAVSESVNVTARNTLMQTDDARVSTNISNELIDKLPLVVGGAMRSVFDLVSTVPEAKGSGTNVSLGGGQGGAFGATLDGISVNTNRNADVVETAFLTPSVEAITEFSVETNGFKPEFGQAGAAPLPLPRSRERTSSTARSTTFSATMRWTRKDSSSRPKASIARTISAGPSADRFRSRACTPERTRRSSSPLTKAS